MVGFGRKKTFFLPAAGRGSQPPAGVVAYTDPGKTEGARNTGQGGDMRREFICHRCGTANPATAENCAYCGLQTGWRPRLPDALRFWRWPAAIKEAVGAAAGPLAVTFAAAFPGSGIAAAIAIPLLAASGLALGWRLLTPATPRGDEE